MKVLIGCERSGQLRRRFRAAGHDAWSCDTEPAEDGSEFHIRDDVLLVIDEGWGLMICHPPCQYLSSSGMHWTTRGIRPRRLTDEALKFALALWNAPIPRVALENPVGILSRYIGKPTQTIQPFQFGDDASKRTCLWLRGLEPLVPDPTKFVRGRLVCGKCSYVITRDRVQSWESGATFGCPICGADAADMKPRWANQTDSGQNKLGPSDKRAAERARTYDGIAGAMVKAWG